MGARFEIKGAGMFFSGMVNMKTNKADWTRKTPAEGRDRGGKSLRISNACKHCKSKLKAGQCHYSSADAGGSAEYNGGMTSKELP
jgi:hypothetical protein